MRSWLIHGCLLIGGLAAALAICLAASGCSESDMWPSPPGVAASQPDPPSQAAVPAKSGAQLWAENCGRCHNLRSPSELSPDQWAVAVHHMRVRVPLTGQEERAIVQFLQAR